MTCSYVAYLPLVSYSSIVKRPTGVVKVIDGLLLGELGLFKFPEYLVWLINIFYIFSTKFNIQYAIVSFNVCESY